MDQQNPSQNLTQEVALHKKHFSAFWPIVIIAVLSALIGGLIVWVAFNQGLDEQLNVLLPGSARTMRMQAERNSGSSTESNNGMIDHVNLSYGFRVQYPKEFVLRASPLETDPENWIEGYIPFGMATGDTGIQAVMYLKNPSEFYEGTDLRQAFFAVKVSNETQTNCGKDDQLRDNGTVNINGKVFTKRVGGGAAAGNQHGRTEFSIYYNNMCYILSEGINTSGYGAIDGLQQVDSAEVHARLNTITSTFKFTK